MEGGIRGWTANLSLGACGGGGGGGDALHRQYGAADTAATRRIDQKLKT